jgi:hypothetical protein
LKVKTAGQAYPVTVYWVWPYVVSQLLLADPPYGALFSDDVRAQLLEDMSSTEGSVKYFLNPNGEPLPDLGDTVSRQDAASLSVYYNQADEYIGKNAQYILLRLDAQLGQAQEKGDTDDAQTSGT